MTALSEKKICRVRLSTRPIIRRFKEISLICLKITTWPDLNKSREGLLVGPLRRQQVGVC